ncbi:MAG: glycosyltransferase [Magnetospirillum sp.]|nr:glycosyltransferase [Magnetospirillum sp.]
MVAVSVVMAVHNGAATVGAAAASILGQQGVDLELVVIDDASTDGTAAVLTGIADPRLVRLRNDGNVGLTASLNRGFAVARGAVIARMDADDISLPGRLAAQLRTLEREHADLCFCRCRFEGPDGRRRGGWKEMPDVLRRWRCLFTNAYGPHPAAMMRRAVFDRLGGYDERFRRGQDYDLWDRAAAAGARFAYLADELLAYRIHPGSISSNHSDEQFETGRIVSDRALARAFPDSTAEERRGLQALCFIRSADVDLPTMAAGLSNVAGRAAAFLAGSPGCQSRAVWADIATALVLRSHAVPAPLVRRLIAAAMAAAWRGRSPRTGLRIIRRAGIGWKGGR